MPGERPYDPFQLQTLTREMIERGSVSIPIPTPDQSNLIHETDFTGHESSGRISRVAIAIGNFVGSSFRIITPEGLTERAEERIERFEKRIEVAAFLGNRILDPRTPGKGPNELIGWVGTHKLTLGNSPDKSAAGYLGKQLIDSKNESQEEIVPNLNRPVTRAERDRDRRLEATVVKSRKLRNDAGWLHDSYGIKLRPESGVRLSPKETKHLGSIAKNVKSLEKKAEKIEARRDAIINNQDPRGRFLRWRLNKAKAVIAKNKQ